MEVLVAALMVLAGIALLFGLAWVLVKLDAPWWVFVLALASCST